MRISVIACALSLLCSGPALAQGLTTGVKGGVNFAQMTLEGPDDSLSLDWTIGAVAGGFVRFPMTSWVELQPEALYSMKGGKAEGVESKVVLDYLEVPVLGWFPLGGATTRYFVVAGPYLGFRLRARTRTAFMGSTEEMDIGDMIERFDFGVVVGGGVERGALVLDGRYSFGLSDVDTDPSDEVKAGNRVISITVGYKF